MAMATVGDIMDTMDRVILDITMDIGEDAAAMDTTDNMDVVGDG